MEKPVQLPIVDFVKEESRKRQREHELAGGGSKKKNKTIYVKEKEKKLSEEKQKQKDSDDDDSESEEDSDQQDTSSTVGSIFSEILNEKPSNKLVSSNLSIRSEEKAKKSDSQFQAIEKKLLKSKCHQVPTKETELLRKVEEARLKKLATAGVVAAMNIVRKKQKEVEQKEIERKKHEVAVIKLKKKEMKETNAMNIEQSPKKAVKEVEKEVEWGVLSDDYFKNPTVKEWTEDS